jgi:phosphoribosylformylglycinamidine synthase
MKRWLPHIGIALGICIAVYALFFSDSEEDLIRERLELLEESIHVSPQDSNVVFRIARIKKQFAEIFVKQVSFEIPELTNLTQNRQELVNLAANAPRLYSTASVDLGGLAIEIDSAKTSAVAYGEATLTAMRHSGNLERDVRTVSLRFDKVEGEWRVVKVSVSAREGSEEPE